MPAFLFPLTRKEVTDIQMSKHRIVGPNDYLLRLIAFSLDYTMQEDFRMLFSQWIASGSFYLRKTLISHLELLYRAQMPRFDEWSINVLAVLLKREQRIALTALKVLEKINLSQSTAKSRSFLIDLIETQPTDSVVGIYGQFLFIKMLSTSEGLRFLKQTNWLANKRSEWISTANRRYTNMLETSLVVSVNDEINFEEASGQASAMATVNKQKPKPTLQTAEELKHMKTDTSEEEDDSTITWLPYHLIHENRSDEEELYHEYLTHLPWSMSITIIRASGQEIEIPTDCFFDYNCFLPQSSEKYPISIGPGVHAIVLDNSGGSKPYHVDKTSRIRIRLNIGNNLLNDMYNKQTLEKIVSMHSAVEHTTYASIHEDQTYFFFEKAPVMKEAVYGRASTVRSPINSSPSSRLKTSMSVRTLKTNASPRFRLSVDDISVVPNAMLMNKSRSYSVEDDKHSYIARVFISLREVKKVHSLVRPLPHFFGELAKTKEGCEYIQEYNDLDKFVSVVKKAKMDENTSSIDHVDLRACLWAIGMIGSSKTGLELLNTTTIVNDICYITKKSPTLSIRGTCLYVLGLLSRSREGMEQLSLKGFDFPADNLELDLAIAIPKNIDEFFEMGDTDYVQSWANNRTKNLISVYSPPHLARPAGNSMKPLDPNVLLGKQGYTEQTVLAHISALCNNVTQKSSASVLHKLRSKKPSVFSNPLLFHEALKVMNTYQYKLAARRFLLFTIFDQVLLDESTIDIFDKDLNESVIGFLKIREWRYHHKQLMLKKRELQHGNTDLLLLGNRNSNKGKRHKSKKQRKFGPSSVVTPVDNSSVTISAFNSTSNSRRESPKKIENEIKVENDVSVSEVVVVDISTVADDNSIVDDVDEENSIECKLEVDETHIERNISPNVAKLAMMNEQMMNGVNIPSIDGLRKRTKSMRKLPPPRPWPPLKYQQEEKQRKQQEIEFNQNVRFKKRMKSIGYDEQLADSPTRQTRGPNPLLDYNPMLEEENID